MNSQRLRYFITAAETLSFTKTAELYYVSQTAISSQIKVLEKELGADLFLRANRGLSLTPAGSCFLGEARRLLVAEEAALQRTRMVANTGRVCARIGLLPSVLGASCARLIRAFKEYDPLVTFSFQSAPEGDLTALLGEGALDCAVMLCPEVPSYDGLHTVVVQHRPLGVVVPRAHPLAGRLRIDREELVGEVLLRVDGGGASEVRDGSVGFGGADDVAVADNACLHAMLAAGMGLCVLPSPHGPDIARDLGMAFVPFRDGYGSEYLVAIRKENGDNPEFARFVPVFDELACMS